MSLKGIEFIRLRATLGRVIPHRLQSVLACLSLWASFAGRGADFSPDDFRRTKFEAEKGDLEAQVALGQMYFSGEGVPQNYKEALKWYRQAAERVFEEAAEAAE